MTIQLIEPHEKQLEIVQACLNNDTFFVVSVVGRQFGPYSPLFN